MKFRRSRLKRGNLRFAAIHPAKQITTEEGQAAGYFGEGEQANQLCLFKSAESFSKKVFTARLI